MSRIVVTGGTGFVGANLVNRLVRDGHQPDLLVRPGFASWRIDSIRDRLRIHEVSLGDAGGLSATVRAIRPKWIFHLAAYGAYSWQTGAAEMIETNVVGTANLLQAALEVGVDAFVNAGSSSEYGRKDHAPSETEATNPDTPYGISKAAATAWCVNAAMAHAANIRTLRLYSVYGPFEDPRRLLPSLIVHGWRGELPHLVDSRTARDFVHVDDAVDAFLLAAQDTAGAPGAIYNIGTGVQTTVADAVGIARRLMNINAEPAWGTMPARTWDTDTWVADARRSRAVLGWSARHTLESGMMQMIDWLRGCTVLRERYEAAWPRRQCP